MSAVFLCGDHPGVLASAEAFVEAAGGPGARIALLLQGDENWQKYVPRYAEPWAAHGASCMVVVPDASGALDHAALVQTFNNANAVFISGGHTPTYQQLYANPPVRGLIREAVARNVPFGGCSAGALLAPDICATNYAGADDTTWTAPGLGLMNNVLIGVHFSEWQGESYLAAAMRRLDIVQGWGIDGSACAVFEDGRLTRVFATNDNQGPAGAVYELNLHSVPDGSYTVRRHTPQCE